MGLPGSSIHEIFQAPPSMGFSRQVDSLSLLQGIFLTQGLNSGLLPCRQMLYHLSYRLSCSVTCGILVSWLMITPWLQGRFLTTGLPEKSREIFSIGHFPWAHKRRVLPHRKSSVLLWGSIGSRFWDADFQARSLLKAVLWGNKGILSQSHRELGTWDDPSEWWQIPESFLDSESAESSAPHTPGSI